MGMSTYLKAFIPDSDETYINQKNVLIACNKAGIKLPKECADYFGDVNPDLYLLEEKLEIELTEGVHYKKWGDDSSEGFEVKIKDLPKGVTKIRFVNSW